MRLGSPLPMPGPATDRSGLLRFEAVKSSIEKGINLEEIIQSIAEETSYEKYFGYNTCA